MSSVKQLQLATDPNFDVQLWACLLDIANTAATAGSTAWAKAAASEASAAPDSSKQTLLTSAAPTLSVWLSVTGRSLMAVGQLLQQAPAWLTATAPYNRSAQQLLRRVAVVSKHGEALTFLQEVLSQLQAQDQHMAETCPSAPAGPSSAAPGSASGPGSNSNSACADVVAAPTDPAAASAAAGRPPRVLPHVSPGVLEQLGQQVDSLLQRYTPLLERLRAVEASGDTDAATSSMVAFMAACGAAQVPAWLPEAVEDLGTAVFSAIPQMFACNQASCSSLEGVTETAGVKRCSGCKVGVSRAASTPALSTKCGVQIQGFNKVFQAVRIVSAFFLLCRVRGTQSGWPSG